MHILIVKTSSLGDVLHTLPALSDAVRAQPGIRFDWVVEEGFAEIPAWHPAVDQVIPLALRRWRRQPLRAFRSGEVREFQQLLREREYALVVDAQGLIKSAALALMARGPAQGLDRYSAREPWAALTYQQRHGIPKQQHAIERVRQLFALALGYALPKDPPDYGIRTTQFIGHEVTPNSLIFLHGTTWQSKHWPLAYWIALARLAAAAGFNVALPWGNAAEYDNARAIAAASPNAELLPRLNLTQLAAAFSTAGAVIGIDTGLAHLAAALSVPTVTIYGATNPSFTGARGLAQVHLSANFPCSPCLARTCHYPGSEEVWPACYQTVQPLQVWQSVQLLLD